MRLRRMSPVFVDIAWPTLARDVSRLTVAAALGSAVGLERQLRHQYAGLRTHALVALGSAAFVLLGHEIAGTDLSAFTRTLQGVILGVGFLGSGTILKLDMHAHAGPPAGDGGVRGLTTAAAIWNAAGIGVAAGTGYLVLALALTALALAVLELLGGVEQRTRLKRHERD